MRFKGITKYIMMSVLMCAFSISAFAQQDAMLAKEGDKSPADKYNEATRPVENYLMRFHSLDRSAILIDENLEKIYMAKVIKTNFKSQHADWDAEYKKVYDEYKTGVDLYYRRDVIYACDELEKNRKHIDEMYQKIAEAYRDDTLKMLDECANLILEVSLDPKTKSDPYKNDDLFKNKARLRIAYGQLDEANSMVRKHNFFESVNHYRVAKTYAILILEDLYPAEQKGKYDLHKADNLNRIFEEGNPKKNNPYNNPNTKKSNQSNSSNNTANAAQ